MNEMNFKKVLKLLMLATILIINVIIIIIIINVSVGWIGACSGWVLVFSQYHTF